MPHVSSTRLINANRENARKSTGPRTQEGKKRSSQNGMRHGLFARDIVVQTGHHAESAEEFEDMLAELRSAMRPRDPVEDMLVLRVAVCNWRLRRAWRYEAGAIGELLDSSGAAGSQIANLDRQIEHARQNAAAMAGYLARAQTNPPPHDEWSCQLRQVALETAARSRHMPDSSAEDPEVIPRLIEILEESVRAAQEEINALQEKRGELLAVQATRVPLVHSLPDAAAVAKITRYENMLDRQLHRALTEFRRRREAQANDHDAMANDRAHWAATAYVDDQPADGEADFVAQPSPDFDPSSQPAATSLDEAIASLPAHEKADEADRTASEVPDPDEPKREDTPDCAADESAPPEPGGAASPVKLQFGIWAAPEYQNAFTADARQHRRPMPHRRD
jgi:hypothetical protein